MRGTLAAGGRTVHLEPRVMGVLASLARHTGQVVTRGEFMREVWQGRIVSDEVLSRCISLLRTTLGDDPRSPAYIETVPKIGYRLIVPVTPLGGADPLPQASLDTGNGAAVPTDAPASPSRASPRSLMHLLAVLVGAAALAAIGWRVAPIIRPMATVAQPTEPGHPSKLVSIAVLPFVNMTPDPKNESLADGISEELLGTLAGIQGLQVAGRTSSFYFKGKNPSTAEVGRRLGVSHVLAGSVRREGDRLRITVQLIDAQSEFRVWTRTFDRQLTGIFDVQEDIARSVTDALQLSLQPADERHLRRRITSDPEDYRAYLLARTRMKLGGEENLRTARTMFEALVTRDPGFAAAHAGLAAIYAAQLRGAGSPTEAERLGRAAADRAVALDPESSEAFRTRGNFAASRYLLRGDHAALEHARADFRRALELDASNTDAYVDLAFAIFREDPDRALDLYRRALEIDPLDRRALLQTANTLRMVGRFDEARERYREIIGLYPDDRSIYEAVALLERLAGHLDEAAILYEKSTAKQGNTFAGFYLWSVYMALGDPAAAAGALQRFGRSTFSDRLQAAARLSMHGRHGDALEVLELAYRDTSYQGDLSVAAAHFALMNRQPARALRMLEERHPGLASGREPIDTVNCVAALELATAWLHSAREGEAQRLLARVAAFLDGPRSPRGPTALFFRAETYALLGDLDSAMATLDLAYHAGFRTTWAVSMTPSLLYCPCPVESDARLGALRTDPRFTAWLERVQADNARQRDRLRTRLAISGPDAGQ